MSNDKFSNASFVSNCKLFSSLTDEEINEITPYFERITIPPDFILFTQGSIPEFLYILIQGELISVLHQPNGKIKILGMIYHPAETIGELSALSGEPRGTTVQSVTDAILLKATTESFIDITKKHPEILSHIIKNVSSRALQTIKLVKESTRPRNVKIIMPLTQAILPQQLFDKFEKEIDISSTKIINANNISVSSLRSIVAEAVAKNKSILIFKSSWDQNIFNLIQDKISHIYVILSEEDKQIPISEIHTIAHKSIKEKDIKLDLILFHSQTCNKITNTEKWLQIAPFNNHHHIRHNNKEDFSRILRFLTERAFAVVLSGGGIKGYVHIGVFKALIERKIPIDAIGGTSIGAAMGGFYVFCEGDLEKTVRIINLMKNLLVKSISWHNLTWPIISLYSGNPLTKKLIHILEYMTIQDLIFPFFAVSANLTQNKEKIHRSGLLWEAIRSSGSVPGILPPVVFDGDLLLDGGLLNNLPVDVMRNILGNGHTILASSLSHKINKDSYNFPTVLPLGDALLKKLHLANKDTRYPPFLQTFLDSLLMGSSTLETKNCIAADILVRPDLTEYKTLSSTYDLNLLIEIGYKATIKALDDYYHQKS